MMLDGCINFLQTLFDLQPKQDRGYCNPGCPTDLGGRSDNIRINGFQSIAGIFSSNVMNNFPNAAMNVSQM